jgi:hypothetical protein
MPYMCIPTKKVIITILSTYYHPGAHKLSKLILREGYRGLRGPE